jgi:hypothetical protein
MALKSDGRSAEILNDLFDPVIKIHVDFRGGVSFNISRETYD